MEHQQLLDTLLSLAKQKEIPYKSAQLRKMSLERLEEVYHEYQTKELDSVNETIADMMIIKFEELLKSTRMIKSDSCLAKKLVERKIFKRDLKHIISYVTPFLPFVGLVEGSVVVAGEVYDNYNTCSNNKNENASSQTSQREQYDQTSADESEHDGDSLD